MLPELSAASVRTRSEGETRETRARSTTSPRTAAVALEGHPAADRRRAVAQEAADAARARRHRRAARRCGRLRGDVAAARPVPADDRARDRPARRRGRRDQEGDLRSRRPARVRVVERRERAVRQLPRHQGRALRRRARDGARDDAALRRQARRHAGRPRPAQAARGVPPPHAAGPHEDHRRLHVEQGRRSPGTRAARTRARRSRSTSTRSRSSAPARWRCPTSVIETWVAKNGSLKLRASRTRRVGPERFEVKGLVEVFDRSTARRRSHDSSRRSPSATSSCAIGRMLCLLEACDLARPA